MPINRSQPIMTLASASPRRRELLSYLGLDFQILPTQGEARDLAPSPALHGSFLSLELPSNQHPTLLAWRKAVTALEQTEGIVLAADTIVVIDNEVLGKPCDESDACAMLERLSGRTHTVYTGLIVLDSARPTLLLTDLVEARVTIATLDPAQIAEYVATGEPLDKAGAYGIQGLGGNLVSAVEGSYTCVVGLPLPATEQLLRAAGINVPVRAEEAFRRWRGTLRKEPSQCTA